MQFIVWLVLGLAAGFLAALAVYRALPRTPLQWVGALVVGLVGGELGGWITDLIGLETVSWLGSLAVAFGGAYLILQIFQRMAPQRA